MKNSISYAEPHICINPNNITESDPEPHPAQAIDPYKQVKFELFPTEKRTKYLNNSISM